MSEPEGLTALLLQLASLSQQLSILDHRQATDARELRDRAGALAALVSTLKADVAGHDEALAAVADLDSRVTDLNGRVDQAGVPGTTGAAGYQPVAVPPFWKLDGDDREAAVTRLRAWVDQVYRPGYGHLAAGLAECWDQHPLCLYVLDWLSELWSVLYLQPRRTAGTLAGQAEWHTRLLAAAAEQLARETRRCDHAHNPQRAATWPERRP